MLFSSYTFLLQFLPVTVLAFAAARRHSPRAGILVLLGASLFFYGAWQPIYLALFLGSIALNFCLGLLMENALRQRAIGILGVTLNLAALCYFKYTGFILDALSALSESRYRSPALSCRSGFRSSRSSRLRTSLTSCGARKPNAMS
jgi:D-alanyl-lipoteichoic acid acyltransferase DltB (MBOAT superfamily)